jgi:uncharacterized protein YecE (DUF72 family)
MNLWLGTCGWSYDEWLDVFYPKKDTPKLSFYSKVFGTAEVDSTFYAYPDEKTVLSWSRYTPLGFRFSLKLPKVITHDKGLSLRLGVERDLSKFLELLKPLTSPEKLGVLLVQLPPSLEADYDLLESFIKVLPLDVFKFAVEFRHKSWWREETWSLLRRCGVANTVVDEPLLPSDAIVTAGHAYVRWHGLGKKVWYDYRYGKEQIAKWIPKVKEIASKSKEVYGYWNNHFHGYAVLNCLEAIEMMGLLTDEQKAALEVASKKLDSRAKTLFDFQEQRGPQ